MPGKDPSKPSPPDAPLDGLAIPAARKVVHESTTENGPSPVFVSSKTTELFSPGDHSFSNKTTINEARPDASLEVTKVGSGEPASDPESARTEEFSTEMVDTSERAAGARLTQQFQQAANLPVIPGYIIQRTLGMGGMGTVYEAEQQHPRRRVALKILNADIGTPSIIRRFHDEAHMLGQLHHPGIAQIYEAGTFERSGSEHMFFAMEYVDGQTLLRSARDRELSTEERLELLAKVCDGVQHAHQRGIIHRDLKPDNILVDPTGQPKILDFGVARGTNDSLRSVTMQTKVGVILGTVPYMSPEQISGNPDLVDTRTDIYALGVIGYLLLTDKLPLNFEGKTILEAARIINEETPAPISSVNRIFRGDVETIIRKAMEKDKNQRYASAAEFAADLRRYLNKEPISARPPSAFYQASKFAQRNKTLVAGIAGIFAVLVLGIIATAWQARVAADERDIARDARAAADKARAASDESLLLAIEARKLADERTAAAEYEQYVATVQFAASRIQGGLIQKAELILMRAPERLRNWEWGHLLHEAHPELRSSGAQHTAGEAARVWETGEPAESGRVAGHTDQVWCAQFSPDGKRIITASSDKTSRIFNAEDMKEITSLKGHGEAVIYASFSPDGKRAATASLDHTARLWNAETGEAGPKLEGHADSVWSARFSPDGSKVVTASLDASARIWDSGMGKELINLGGQSERVWFADFSPDGTKIVTASGDKTLKIFSAADGALVTTLKGHNEQVLTAHFSPDGKRLLSGCRDMTARVWDVATGAMVFELAGHKDQVLDAEWSGDGSAIATASRDTTVRLWDAANGKQIGQIAGHGDAVTSACFTPDGRRILTASADKTVKVWTPTNRENREILAGHTDRVLHAQFSPDGRTVVTASADGTARLWDAATGWQIALLAGHTAPVRFSQFSPDGTKILTTSLDQSARIWDAKTGEPLKLLEGHTRELWIGWFSPDGKKVLTSSWDNLLKLWDVETGAEVLSVDRSIEASKTGQKSPFTIRDPGLLDVPIYDMGFNNDGSRIVVNGSAPFAWIMNAADGKEVLRLKGHKGIVYDAQFSPDGKSVLTMALDNKVKVWDAQTGVERATFTGHSMHICSPQFSPDSKLVVTASGYGPPKLWEAATGTEIASFEGHSAPVLLATFSPDGTRLLTASVDKTAKIWDLTGRELATLEGHTDKLIFAAFSPDGRRIVTTSYDNTARIWDAVLWREIAKVGGDEVPLPERIRQAHEH